MLDFHGIFRVLLHAANLRHGTDDFTSPPKEGVLRIYSPLKFRRLWPGLNPWTWVLKASMLPLDHRSYFWISLQNTPPVILQQYFCTLSHSQQFFWIGLHNTPPVTVGSISVHCHTVNIYFWITLQNTVPVTVQQYFCTLSHSQQLLLNQFTKHPTCYCKAVFLYTVTQSTVTFESVYKTPLLLLYSSISVHCHTVSSLFRLPDSVLKEVCFLLGNSPATEFYMPTFRTLSVPSS
jgi:hypothetical protein